VAKLSTRIYWFLYLAIFVTGTIKIANIIYLSNIIFLALFFFSALQCVWRGQLKVPRDQFVLFGFFVAMVIASFYISSDKKAAREIVQILIFFGAIFFPSFSLTAPADLKRWIGLTALGCTTNAIAGLIQTILWIHTHGFSVLALGLFFRVQGLCVSPIDYVMELMVGLYVTRLIEKPRLKMVLLAFYCFLLLISFSRSGLVILFLTLGIKIASEGLKDRKKALLYIASALSAIPVLFYLNLLGPVTKRINDIGNVNFNIKRFVTYQDVIGKVFKSASSLTIGSGFGTYSFLNPVDWYELYTDTHNVYLYVLYCMGFFGLVIFISSIIFLVGKTLFLLRAWMDDPFRKALLQSVLMIHLCTWLVGLVEVDIEGVDTGWLLGSVFGVPLALKMLDRSA